MLSPQSEQKAHTIMQTVFMYLFI